MVVVVGLILQWVTMVNFVGFFFFSPVVVAGSGWLLGS